MKNAAEYVRMSTDSQKYSIDNQRVTIRRYAEEHGYEVTRTFSDPGISGLDLKHRPGLRSLLEIVVSGKPGFDTILVLDVTRWGRFQDVDESAYYEFLCRQAGVQVEYCGEPFANDLSPYSSLLKAIKRTMAAEYSRELGVKSKLGAMRLARDGFKQGGIAGLGLERVSVDEHKKNGLVLSPGECKRGVTDRVILTLGSQAEMKVVRYMFDAFASGRSIRSIAAEMQHKKACGLKWNQSTVGYMLQNPKYGGTYVYNRASSRLGATKKANPVAEWAIAPKAIPSVVPRDTFLAVQRRFANLTIRRSDSMMLEHLKDLWSKWGYLSAEMMNADPESPSTHAYCKRFGSIENAYRIIGYTSDRRGSGRRRLVSDLRRRQWQLFASFLEESGYALNKTARKCFFINPDGVPRLSLVMAVPLLTEQAQYAGPQWRIRNQSRSGGAHVLAVLSTDLRSVREYWICSDLRATNTIFYDVDLAMLARISLARFTLPEDYFPALRRARLLL